MTARPGVLLLAAIALASQSSRAIAQRGRRELVGFVRDTAGVPVEDAIVEIPGSLGRSDARGAFRLWTNDVDTLSISIRRLGYTAINAMLTARNRRWDTVVVELERNARSLAPLTVSEPATRRAVGLREFEERRAKGLGVFVTRQEIAARNTARPSDLLRGAKGVRLVKLRDGTYGVRFALYSSSRSSCSPDMWLDGQRVRGMEMDDLTANDIEAMELYESWSTVPAQFSPAATMPCGTIVIWTRVPGSA